MERELAGLPGVPSGTPETVTGTDGKRYAATTRQTHDIHDDYEYAWRIADLGRWSGEPWGDGLGISVSPQVRLELATQHALRCAARELLRTGRAPEAPAWFIADSVGRFGDTVRAHIGARQEWDLRVQVEAGRFLNWCEAAGITSDSEGQWAFAEVLRYPREDGDEAVREALDAEGPEWEELAVRGAFSCWLRAAW